MIKLPQDNLLYPVLISDPKGNPVGSGFYLNTDDAMHLATAKHVLYDYDEADKKWRLRYPTINVLSYEQNFVTEVTFTIDFAALPSGTLKPHPKADVVLIKITEDIPGAAPQALGTPTQFIAGVKKTSGMSVVGLSVANFGLFNDVYPSNEVFIFGFPTSLRGALDPKRPLLRRGIVAGKNAKDQTIVLDCPVYQGNSGGLAVEVNPINLTQVQFRAIGVVAKFVPFVDRFVSRHFGYENTSVENSGYSIVEPMDRVKELL